MPFFNYDDLIKLQLRRLKKKHINMVEIGAFDGVYLQQYVDWYRGITIHAIEPCKRNYSALERRYRKCRQVHPVNCAISSKEGKRDLFIVDHPKYEGTKSSQSNSLYKSFAQSKKSSKTRVEQVETLTLKHFCARYKIELLDLLKCNCEGGEYDIFTDTQATVDILSRTNIIDIVIHGKSPLFIEEKYRRKKREINALLKDLGFVILVGPDLQTIKKLPYYHIRQVWTRDKLK